MKASSVCANASNEYVIFSFFRHFGESETRQVRRNHIELVCQPWNQFTKHKRRRRKPMQQLHHRRFWVTPRAIKHFDSICLHFMNGGHGYSGLGKEQD